MNQPVRRGLTDVGGLAVGHAQDESALTGCTVILCREGAVAGVDVRGGAPGTRETDLLNPVNFVERVHAIVLAGGSAFGLDAASGVVRYLEEQGIGYQTAAAKVPIVPAAILYDLAVGHADVRPDAAMGYRAATQATSDLPQEGNVGAGTGASVGKLLGMQSAMKAGIGTWSIELMSGLCVGALVAVNALGDVVDPTTGEIIAGLRGEQGFADSLDILKQMPRQPNQGPAHSANTVIGVVATNALLTKAQATKVAQMSQDGIARAIRPAHTLMDGDTVFALSTGQKQADVSLIGALGAEVLAQAVVRAAKLAPSLGGLPGLG